MIDQELVNRKYKLIQQDLKQAKKLEELSWQQFLSDETYELLAERILERIIGRMIDTNNHIIAEMGEPPASDYFESFVVLGRLGVLKVEKARDLAQYAGLRNRLAHEYNEIDRSKVFERLQNIRQDVMDYFKAVKKFINQQS